MPVKECMRRGATFSASKDGSAGGVVLKKLSPTAPGAKRLATRYGKALVCVRYREDLARGRRLTTVELVVDERPLPPPVAVRVGLGESELGRQVRAAGGVWDWKRKVWHLEKAAIRKLKIDNRVVAENA